MSDEQWHTNRLSSELCENKRRPLLSAAGLDTGTVREASDECIGGSSVQRILSGRYIRRLGGS